MPSYTYPTYEPTPPLRTIHLPVTSLHTLHLTTHGNPDGPPVLFLHGGPGGGCTPQNLIFFNPKIYHIILPDQRGAGKSTPAAEIRENTTHDLISDIETIRQKLEIEKWFMVFGGSWGSTLALAYVQRFSERVGSLVLRGVFCVRESEVANANAPYGVWSQLFPERYERFTGYLRDVLKREGKEEGAVDMGDAKVITAEYYRLICDEDERVSLAAAREWNVYELGNSTLLPDEGMLNKVEDEVWSLQHARFECHYFVHGAWLEEGELLREENLAKIRHIPCEIVQGRYDVVCPPKTAWELHKALPLSKLHMIVDAGHSGAEPGTRAKLTEICDQFAKEAAA